MMRMSSCAQQTPWVTRFTAAAVAGVRPEHTGAFTADTGGMADVGGNGEHDTSPVVITRQIIGKAGGSEIG